MSNADPLVIIERRRDGYRLIVRRSQLTSDRQYRSFVEVRRVLADESDDYGAWDTGPLYVIQHGDGTQYAVTYDNWYNRYRTIGFSIMLSDGTVTPPDVVDVVPGMMDFSFATQSGLLALIT